MVIKEDDLLPNGKTLFAFPFLKELLRKKSTA